MDISEGITKIEENRKRKIPSFNTPRVVEFEMEVEPAIPAVMSEPPKAKKGQKQEEPKLLTLGILAKTMPCSIRRANARTGITMLALFGSLLGETLGHIVSYSDEHNPEQSKLRALVNAEMSLAGLKSYLTAHALPELFKSVADVGGDFYKLYENLLPGYLTIDGVLIETEAELEEAGPSGAQMIELLWKACEVNFFPTSGAPPTNDGGERQDESEPAKVPPRVGTKRQKSKRAATKTGGRSVRMSKKNG